MLSKLTSWCAACAMATLLTACGGGTDAPASAVSAAPIETAMTMPTTTIESTVVTMHGGGASVIASREVNPAPASDAEREAMEMNEVEYEKSFSIEKNRQYAEQLAREHAAEEALRKGMQCSDPDMTECARANNQGNNNQGQ